MSKKKKKGMSVANLQGVAMAIVVAAISIAIGGSILSTLQVSQCVGTYGTYNNTNIGTLCCSSVNASNTNQCLTMQEGSVAYNITGFGLTSLSTMGQWIPLLALVIIASVIIVVVIRSFGGGKEGI